MQLLNQAVVREQLTMTAAIDAIEQLLVLQHHHPDWVKSPERLVIPTFEGSNLQSQGSHLSMPATIFDGTNEFAVVKLVTICPDNPKRNLPTTTANITVSDNATGRMLAIMDGSYITEVRTAALSGIATKLMAKRDCQSVAVIGCGGMAFEQLNATLSVRPSVKRVYLWNRSQGGATAFKAKFEQDYFDQGYFDNSELIVCDNINDALKEADIINVATRATQGLFCLNQIKNDAHINAVGAYLPSMKEISNDIITKSQVIVDDIIGSKAEAGDLIQAHEAADCSWEWGNMSGDLRSLLISPKKIDTSKLTLFKSVGAASFDAAVGLYLAKKTTELSLGQQVAW